jgi:hypothetical protein
MKSIGDGRHRDPTWTKTVVTSHSAKVHPSDGKSIDGMPTLEVVRGKDGKLRINDGVTRATRVAKLLPGQTVPVEVIQTLPNLDVARYPTIKDVLP